MKIKTIVFGNKPSRHNYLNVTVVSLTEEDMLFIIMLFGYVES